MHAFAASPPLVCLDAGFSSLAFESARTVRFGE